MPKYTDEQIERARSVNLEYLLRLRGEKLLRSGGEYRWVYRDGSGEHDSVTIRSNRWYDHKRSIGGDTIGFLQEFMGFDFKAAVAELLRGETPGQSTNPGRLRTAAVSAETRPEAERYKYFKLPQRNSNMRRLYAYLTKTRHLAPNVITHFVRAGALYEDAAHHNAVFLGLDETGTAHAAHLKGTTTGNSFRQTLAGSDTRYGFHHKGKPGRLYVFEAPIDMLSYISMHQQDWQQHSYIALDGLSSKAMHYFLAQNPQVTEICLCLDNDAAGVEAAGKFRAELTANGYVDVKRLASSQKDWNEDIKARLGLPAIPAQPHPKIEAYRNMAELLHKQDMSAYAEYLKTNGTSYAVNSIRRELDRLGSDPADWEPRLLRVAALCVASVRENFLSRLAGEYEPCFDKGKLKSHLTEVQAHFVTLRGSSNVAEFAALADACIRTCVSLQIDFAVELERSQSRESPAFEMAME